MSIDSEFYNYCKYNFKINVSNPIISERLNIYRHLLFEEYKEVIDFCRKYNFEEVRHEAGFVKCYIKKFNNSKRDDYYVYNKYKSASIFRTVYSVAHSEIKYDNISIIIIMMQRDYSTHMCDNIRSLKYWHRNIKKFCYSVFNEVGSIEKFISNYSGIISLLYGYDLIYISNDVNYGPIIRLYYCEDILDEEPDKKMVIAPYIENRITDNKERIDWNITLWEDEDELELLSVKMKKADYKIMKLRLEERKEKLEEIDPELIKLIDHYLYNYDITPHYGMMVLRESPYIVKLI